MKPEEGEVVILMGLFNAGPLLAPQLESLRRQSHTAWRLIVSDDGSHDAGPALVQAFAQHQPDHDIALIKGPGQGFARNFVHLIRAAGPQVPYAAFSDQDDVWLPQKLARAVAALAELRADRPALYCART
ncbi:MAG: glycosyltransferase, partial [Paracoccaceae bacterium]|nr:glycosyltransferase [Paracoccaceae bacterium]